MVTCMDHADWNERWETGQIQFHQPNVSDYLERYASEVWGTDPLERVYVPLCGKSLDMVFLADRAKQVVGVEFVEQAVVDFFDERGLEPTVDTDMATKYQADQYTLYAADFFAITNDELGTVDAVFDRAALVALDGPTRIRYAQHLATLLVPGATMLLITFDYDQSAMDGPPFSVSADEVQRLFDDDFAIELLDTRDVLNDPLRSRGLTAMHELAFVLTRR